MTLWDARTLRAAGELRGLPRTTSQALAFSPDGRRLAAAELGTVDRDTASDDGTCACGTCARRAPTAVRFR